MHNNKANQLIFLFQKKGLPPPYATNCGEKELKYHDHYSQKACLLEHLTQHTAQYCGCRAPYMANNGLPFCSLNKTIECVPKARESFAHKDTQHKREVCPIECTEVSFDYKLTEARYVPHDKERGMKMEPTHTPYYSDEVHPDVFARHKNIARDEIEQVDDIHSSGNLYVR